MFNKPQRSPLLWLLILFLGHNLHSQNPVIANASMAEKIYLQLDKNIYASNETIWFKAIIASAANHMTNTLSGVLHVELIGPDEQVLEKKLVQINNGIGDNFFELHETYPEGKLLLRAYTKWNRNFDTDFIFRTYVHVFPAPEKHGKELITGINLKEKIPEQLILTAQFYPLITASSNPDKLDIFLNLDGKKDTVAINPNQEGTYLLNYEIENIPRLATLSFPTKTGLTYSKTVPLKKNLFDIQFMPESGALVHELTNLIGVKVLDYAGRGKSIEGKIINERGEVVTTFKSNHLGMGKFYIRADSSQTYSARIFPKLAEDQSLEYPLPTVAKEGSILSVIQRNEAINLMVSSNYKEQDSVYIRVSCRGIVHYILQGKLKEGQAVFSVPEKGLPEGIIAFTLMDRTMTPTAERLFFNERPESRLNLNISSDKTIYNQREKTAINIKVTNGEGREVRASLSMLAVNISKTGSFQETRKNILTELLLDSELRGEIEDPGYYFRSGNEHRRRDLDALLLTQGWRRYKFDQPPRDALEVEPEITLNVSGTLGGIFDGNNLKEGIGISLMTFGNSPTLSVQETDSLGRFYFPLKDERGQRLNILLQSTNKSGKNRNYTISLNEQASPGIVFDQEQALEEFDSLAIKYVQKKKDESFLTDELNEFENINQLNEVVLDGYHMTAARKKVMEVYGKPDSVIKGTTLREKEQKWSYGLYSVLASNFPKDIRFMRIGGAGGYMKAEVVGGDETVVLIDGIPIREDDFPLIPNIPTSEVKSVEIIRHVQNFHHLYKDVYPESSAIDAPMWGSIIAIYTDGGTGILGANQPKGVLKASVPVFSPSREFYAPGYETRSSRNAENLDSGTTLFWKPQLPLNTAGEYIETFYNSDTTGNTLVIIEAISEDGEIGYEELIYEVIEKR